MLLARLAQTSADVTAASGRKEKSDLLAAVIVDLEPIEIEAAIGFLTGSPRQGAIGVGWATVTKLDVAPAITASLSIGDLDNLLSSISQTRGPGSVTTRSDLLGAFFSRATELEHDFVRRVIMGDLRQGALGGVVTEAVSKASGVKQALFRRAVMLQGDLGTPPSSL